MPVVIGKSAPLIEGNPFEKGSGKNLSSESFAPMKGMDFPITTGVSRIFYVKGAFYEKT